MLICFAFMEIGKMSIDPTSPNSAQKFTDERDNRANLGAKSAARSLIESIEAFIAEKDPFDVVPARPSARNKPSWPFGAHGRGHKHVLERSDEDRNFDLDCNFDPIVPPELSKTAPTKPLNGQ